jgi:hypothetical protein
MIPVESKSFKFARVKRREDIPAVDPRIIDVAILDMNYGYPNLGHDSLALSIGSIERELAPLLASSGLSLRVITYEVRNCGMVPELPGGRFQLYLGTGGPGHIDPAQNDGASPWSQGVREDVPWEPAAHRLFEAILRDPDAAFLGICHSFGVLCRWTGLARPTLRGPEKGGKSMGVKQVLLTEEGCQHPWFSRFRGQLADGCKLSVTDSRLFDLIPAGQPLPPGMTAIAHEVLPSGERGDALTMLELARDRAGVMPRFFAVNSHPEIFDAGMQQRLVNERLVTGAVTPEWTAERRRVIANLRNPAVEWKIRLTSRITLLDPLRFYLYRLVRLRHEMLAARSPVHEDEVVAVAA